MAEMIGDAYDKGILEKTVFCDAFKGIRSVFHLDSADMKTMDPDNLILPGYLDFGVGTVRADGGRRILYVQTQPGYFELEYAWHDPRAAVERITSIRSELSESTFRRATEALRRVYRRDIFYSTLEKPPIVE